MLIDTTGLATGNYTLVLQSFDENSGGVESTLKTDTIQIVVNEPILPFFTENIEAAVIYSGTKVSWTLPKIDPGYSPLTSI